MFVVIPSDLFDTPLLPDEPLSFHGLEAFIVFLVALVFIAPPMFVLTTIIFRL